MPNVLGIMCGTVFNGWDGSFRGQGGAVRGAGGGQGGGGVEVGEQSGAGGGFECIPESMGLIRVGLGRCGVLPRALCLCSGLDAPLLSPAHHLG